MPPVGGGHPPRLVWLLGEGELIKVVRGGGGEGMVSFRNRIW